MIKKDFIIWAEKFLKAWADLNPERALAVLSKDVEYYETPFSKPCQSWVKVKKLWQVVPYNQKNIKYKFKVLLVSGNLGVIHWRISRITIPNGKYQEIDGVFLVKLNNKGSCTFFKQWRAVKE